MGGKLVLIDGHSILNRAFYGIPDLTNSEGLHTNAVYGFLNIMFKILEEEHPDYLTVAFDVHQPTFRHEMYAEYKGTRKPMAEELRQQVPLIKEMLTAMGVTIIEKGGYEADDLLGTIAKRSERDGAEVSVISGDRDLLQLASDHIRIRIPKTKKTGTEIEDYYAKEVRERYLVTPEEFIDVKALMGDASDNIPGVPGIGEKTATAIIAEYGSIENAYAHVDEIKPKRASANLKEYYEQAQLSKTLATIETDADIDYDLQSARLERMEELYTKEAYLLCRRLEFRNLLSRFQVDAPKNSVGEHFKRISDRGEAERAFADARGKDCAFYFVPREEAHDEHMEADGQMSLFGAGGQLSGGAPDAAAGDAEAVADPAGAGNAAPGVAGNADGTGAVAAGEAAQLPGQEPAGAVAAGEAAQLPGQEPAGAAAEETAFLGLAFAYGPEDIYYMEAGSGLSCAVIRELFVNSGAASYATLDLKRQLGCFGMLYRKQVGDVSREKLFDGAVAAYLLNPLKNDYPCEDIAKDYGSLMISSRQDLLGKLTLDAASGEKPEEFLKYVCYMAYTAYLTKKTLVENMQKTGMDQLFWTIEMPLIFTLADMEYEGIIASRTALKEYGDRLAGRIGELETKIYREAGEKFNINSPKQLGVVLFDNLKLPNGKKTKTGYSTAADVLEPLAAEHQVVADILEYRQLTKLKSTYADGLTNYIAGDGRIHTSFNQTITATGRLSSTEPNLQNIPMRIELGRLIRKAFLPKEGSVFVDADYSQIELRVLAHLSGDEKLIKAYREAQDIHRTTASQVFHIPFDEVTDLQRRNAKAVNFGIVYGISSFGLSQDLSITKKEAADYIERYFETYPKIRGYLNGLVADAKKNGYVTTMFGRRRPVPELSSSNFMQRSFGERIAMNSPIQGTAADIIKIAMIRVHDRLMEEKLQSRLILTVHDELLVETKESEEQAVRQILQEEMKGAADLAVTLEIDVHSGHDWYEAK